jgi:hypothetical protein
VPEKAEAFLREALCAASDELPLFVAMMIWLAAPDQRKASFFRPVTRRVGAIDLTTAGDVTVGIKIRYTL